MKTKKLCLLMGATALSFGMCSAALVVSNRVNGFSELKANGEPYSLTISAPIYEGTATSSVGQRVYKTALNNDVKLEYNKLDQYQEGYQHTYAEGVNCMIENGAYIAIVANGEGHGVAGIQSIELLVDNDTYGSSTLTAWYGWSDGDYVKGDSRTTSDGTHELSFRLDDTEPTFVKLELSGGESGNRVGIHEMTINYSCTETTNPYTVSGDYVLIEKPTYFEVDSYTGTSVNLSFPASVGGKPVTRIVDNFKCTNITKNDIESVTLPSSITYIGDYAFYYAQKLEAIDLSHVTRIGDYAFNYCTKLASIGGFDSIVSIGTNAFYTTEALEIDVTFPASLTVINGSAFMSSSIHSVTIHDDAEASIYDAAFRNIDELESIYIGDSVEYFYDDLVFNDNLSSITVGPNNQYNKAVDNVLYRKNSSGYWTLVRIAQKRPQTVYIMPNDVNNIDPYSAYEASTLESLTFNDNITNIPDYSFSNCSNLRVINFGSAIEHIEYCFDVCTSLESLHFPASLRRIDQQAFADCTSLTSVVFEEGCEFLAAEVFQDCTALTTVVLPTTLEDTGDCHSWSGSPDAFDGCTALTNVFTRLTSGTYSGENIRSGWYGSRTMNLYSATELAGYWHFNNLDVPVLW